MDTLTILTTTKEVAIMNTTNNESEPTTSPTPEPHPPNSLLDMEKQCIHSIRTTEGPWMEMKWAKYLFIDLMEKQKPQTKGCN
jgi:hypothetical protein